MRRQDDIGETAQFVILRQRLERVRNVERRTSDSIMARAISATGAAMASGAFVTVTRSTTLSSI